MYISQVKRYHYYMHKKSLIIFRDSFCFSNYVQHFCQNHFVLLLIFQHHCPDHELKDLEVKELGLKLEKYSVKSSSGAYFEEYFHEQSFSALMIFVSAAHLALFSKNMSGALVCANFLKDERRSRQRSRKAIAHILRSQKAMRS